MALSIANQLLSISQLKNDMLALKQWWTHVPATYIVGGIFGIPFGFWVMANLAVAHLTFVTGIILVAYVMWVTNKPHSIFVHRSGTIQHLAVGMLGGAIGGFTAFPGCALVIWAGFKNMNKFDESFWVLFFLLLPVVLPMTNLGVFAFKKLSDVNFKSITLGVLAFSGTGLIYKSSATVFLLFTASSLVKY
jgi:hypothetical protein